MTVQELVKRFFMNERKGSYRGLNVSFRNNSFFSYETEIARIIKLDNRDVLLLSDFHFSSTTSRHIKLIEDNNPFNLNDIYYVSNSLIRGRGVYKLALEEIKMCRIHSKYISKQMFRNSFMKMYRQTERLIDLIDRESHKEKIYDKLHKLDNILEECKKINRMRAKQKENREQNKTE